MRLGHLNLVVADTDRAERFYARWFGFNRRLAEYPDGTRFFTDVSGFELAFHQSPEPATAREWHFGFLAKVGEVRDLRRSMEAGGVVVLEAEDSPAYVGFKCLDPDGHVIEVYAEAR